MPEKLYAQQCPSCGGTYRVPVQQRGQMECSLCQIPCVDLEAKHADAIAASKKATGA